MCPAGGSNAYGVPSDASRLVSVPPSRTPSASPGRSTSTWLCEIRPAGSARVSTPGEGVEIVGALPFREAAVDHRPVEADDAALAGQPREQRGVVAVADERLRGAADVVRVEQRQEVHAAVSAADGDQRGDRRIRPGLAEGGGARGVVARGEAMAREDRLVVDRLVSQAGQLGHAGVERRAAEGAGGRDDADAIAGPQRARLEHSARRTSPFRRRPPGARRCRGWREAPRRWRGAGAAAPGTAPSRAGGAPARPRCA